MAQELIIYTKCQHCGGAGETIVSAGIYGETIPCNWPNCENGYIALNKIIFDPGHDDIMDKCNDILVKCNDILEAIS